MSTQKFLSSRNAERRAPRNLGPVTAPGRSVGQERKRLNRGKFKIPNEDVVWHHAVIDHVLKHQGSKINSYGLLAALSEISGTRSHTLSHVSDLALNHPDTTFRDLAKRAQSRIFMGRDAARHQERLARKAAKQERDNRKTRAYIAHLDSVKSGES